MGLTVGVAVSENNRVNVDVNIPVEGGVGVIAAGV
jgi:hypothetical protein